jgi:hypothetical protein
MKDSLEYFGTAARRWSGMGPYYAMFPSAFADSVVESYSCKGDTVLDPFAGRGTAVYSAAISGRCALGVEINPVGWVYARTKVAPADQREVDARLLAIHARAKHYATAARALPEFFRYCFSPAVNRFLLAARDLLNWRRNRIDRTLMAFVLINLHGKVSDSLSNQMRQTKAMSPSYAIAWWRMHGARPPQVDPVDFLRKKLNWRYAKGRPTTANSQIFLGDSVEVLPELVGSLGRRLLSRASLMITSPPYLGITNYHYDQWLRLWVLGGPPTPLRGDTHFRGKHRGKFESVKAYKELLLKVFSAASSLLRKDAIVYVRTDRRGPTLSSTREILETVFPKHSLTQKYRPSSERTQTTLFGNSDPRMGEVDLLLTR